MHDDDLAFVPPGLLAICLDYACPDACVDVGYL